VPNPSPNEDGGHGDWMLAEAELTQLSGHRMTLDELTALEEIRRLKAAYFRCIDTKDWTALEALCTPDVEADMRDASGTRDESAIVRGAHAFADGIRRSVSHLVTVHHGHSPELTLSSPTTATGIWAMEDKLWAVPGVANHLPFSVFHGFGHYHERYERFADGWRIKATRLTRLRVDTIAKPVP
jgi:hypothetical protein